MDATIHYDFKNFEINPYLFHLLRFLHFYIQITQKILSEFDDFLSKHLSFLPFLRIFMEYFHFHFLLILFHYLSHYCLILFTLNHLHVFRFALLSFLMKSLLWNIFLINPSKYINLNYKRFFSILFCILIFV